MERDEREKVMLNSPTVYAATPVLLGGWVVLQTWDPLMTAAGIESREVG